jgi:hypothetical protein
MKFLLMSLFCVNVCFCCHMKHSLVLLGLSSVFLSLFYLSHWVLTEVGLGKKEIGSDIQTMLQLKKKI